ncbi:ABC transporter permease [Halovenus salina]|uniref:ABC transporter permease n=1 Tax=Halovenus salina TaxID=1510225 RepID=A0ABD5W0H7_9EURY
MSRIRRYGGIGGIALRQLVYHRVRTLLTILGIVLAVLSVTLLLGIGAGVLETGEQLVDSTERDLWISGGPTELNPESVGGFRNPIVDSHAVAAEIDARDDVSAAVPLAYNAVYISTDGEEFETVLSVGVGGSGPAISLQAGEGFSPGDTHLVDGEYTGPLNQEVIIGPDLADKKDLAPGDTLYLGGTLRNAKANEFSVVGISPTFSTLTGTETVTVRLSDLQTLTAMSLSDRSSLITVTVTDDADVETVHTKLQQAYPDFTIRTNQEQITAVLERQALILTGGLSLSLLALLAGIFFSLNLFLSLIYQQRTEFAIFRATGGSTGSILLLALLQAVVIALLGVSIGMLLTPIAATALEEVTIVITGFEGQ